MKVLIAVHHFPPHHTGGAEWRAYRTAVGLRNRGHDVYVICVEAIDIGDGNGLTFEDDLYDGLPIRRLSFNLDAAPDPFRWAYDNPWIGEHMRSYLADLAPDVVHLISGYLMSGSTIHAAHDLGVPTVVTLTDFWFLCPRITLLRSNGQLCAPSFDAISCARCLGEVKRRYRIPGTVAPRLMDAFWRWQTRRIAQVQARKDFLWDTLNRAHMIISPSRFLRRLFVQAGVASDRIVFSRQGRDLPDLVPEGPEKPSTTRLRIGYLGQIAPHKGVRTLFEAVRQLPGADLEVKVYGDLTRFPRYARSLRRMACRDARVKLMGTFDRTEVSRVLQGLDVVVVPSVWYENSPNAVLEAFAHRVPVVASDAGGIKELVHHGENGLLFASGDAGALADQLKRLLVDPAVLPVLRAGIAPVKSMAQEMDELEDIYSQVTARKLQTSSSESPLVTIIVLNWNGLADTLECLESLADLDYSTYKVAVVDNGSNDGVATVIRERFPTVTVLENGENLGYAGGNNVGLEHALAQGADYALLLNNDTKVTPDFLSRLVDAAESDPRIGVAGPTIYYYERPGVIWSAGGFIDWQRGSTRMVGLDEPDEGQCGTEPRGVDFVTGCALLVRRAVMERVGLLDERFFAYYEETEWCVRAVRAGFKIVHVPQAHIWHKISPSSRANSPLVHYYMTRNRLLFLKAAEAGVDAWIHTLLAEYLRTWVSWSLRPKWRDKRVQRRVMLWAVRDALRGQWGKSFIPQVNAEAAVSQDAST